MFTQQQVIYAIRCLIYLAQKEGAIRIKQIAEDTNMPRPFLAKIINTLTRKGFLESQRGVGGGVRLKREPENISLYEICNVFDDPILQRRCVLGMPECGNERACAFHNFWSKKKEKIIKYLQKNSIATMVVELRKTTRKPKRRSKTRS